MKLRSDILALPGDECSCRCGKMALKIVAVVSGVEGRALAEARHVGAEDGSLIPRCFECESDVTTRLHRRSALWSEAA